MGEQDLVIDTLESGYVLKTRIKTNIISYSAQVLHQTLEYLYIPIHLPNRVTYQVYGRVPLYQLYCNFSLTLKRFRK